MSFATWFIRLSRLTNSRGSSAAQEAVPHQGSGAEKLSQNMFFHHCFTYLYLFVPLWFNDMSAVSALICLPSEAVALCPLARTPWNLGDHIHHIPPASPPNQSSLPASLRRALGQEHAPDSDPTLHPRSKRLCFAGLLWARQMSIGRGPIRRILT